VPATRDIVRFATLTISALSLASVDESPVWDAMGPIFT